MINKMGGKFLIMTATLPPFIKEYLEENITDLVISPPFFNNNIRHILTLISGEMDFAKIAKEGQNKKVLVICNTVEKACNAYKSIKEHSLCSVNLLHSRFIQKDRLRKEQEIKYFASSKEKGVWVCTQLVEASLDIDFDFLFTEMSTADSLLQRMGRCYRSREYKDTKPNIFIFDNKSGTGYGKGSIYDYELYQRSVNELHKYCNKPFSEKQKQEYIECVYDTLAIKNTNYHKSLLDQLKFLTDNLLTGEFEINEARKKFREIEASTVIPFTFLEQAKSILKSIKSLPTTKCKETLLAKKKLQESLKEISLQVNLFNSRKYAIHKDSELNQAYITILANKYDEEIGLLDLSNKGAIF